MIITPQDELDAVNEILSSIGSSPVSSLEDDSNIDVINAKRILNGVSQEIQSRGWFFNTLEMIHLDPEDNRNGKLNVPCPNSYLRFEAPNYKLIRRNGYFFDVYSQTNVFPEGLDIKILVKELPFSELPEQFRKYITVRASRIFQMRYLGDDGLDLHLQTEETAAYADVVDYDLTTGDYNVFEDGDFIQIARHRGVPYAPYFPKH